MAQAIEALKSQEYHRGVIPLPYLEDETGHNQDQHCSVELMLVSNLCKHEINQLKQNSD